MKKSKKAPEKKPKKANPRTGETSRKKLTEMQEKFCYFFVFVDVGDAVSAYKRAGSENTNDYELARVTKDLLDKNQLIKAKVLELQTAKNNMKMVDIHYVIKRLVTIVEDEDEQTQYVLKALELIGKYLKMFTEKIIEKTVEKVKDDALAATEARMKRDAEAKKPETVENLAKQSDNLIPLRQRGDDE